MPTFLILRLDGPMQAWGTHTFEDFRPSNLFPTRSGLLGLLAACLGIERNDQGGLNRLGASVEFAVRIDRQIQRSEQEQATLKPGVKLPDFHTVMAARKVDGSVNKHPIVSRREYLFDAAFTVAVGSKPDAPISLAALAEALRRPLYTPSLGRRACPLARPLFEGLYEAESSLAALANVRPAGGLIYSELDISGQPVRMRDVPIPGHTRQFGTHLVYLHKEPSCS